MPALGGSHHDCGSLEAVVLSRKRDQRQVINHSPNGVSIYFRVVKSMSNTCPIGDTRQMQIPNHINQTHSSCGRAKQ